MAISQEMPQPSITKIRLKITYLKFYWNSPGANELMGCPQNNHMIHNGVQHKQKRPTQNSNMVNIKTNLNT